MTTPEDLVARDEAIAEAEGLLNKDEWYFLQASLAGQWDTYYDSIGFNGR